MVKPNGIDWIQSQHSWSYRRRFQVEVEGGEDKPCVNQNRSLSVSKLVDTNWVAKVQEKFRILSLKLKCWPFGAFGSLLEHSKWYLVPETFLIQLISGWHTS